MKKETRFFRCDFIDEMTFDLKSKRHLKFASFLDEIGKKEEKEKFLKELQNKVFYFLILLKIIKIRVFWNIIQKFQHFTRSMLPPMKILF